MFSLNHRRFNNTAGQSRVYSSTPACLLKLPDDTTDIKQTFTASTPRGSRVKVYETLASEKMKFGVSSSLCRVFFSLSALSLSLCQCVVVMNKNDFLLKVLILCPTLYATNTHIHIRVIPLRLSESVTPKYFLQLSPDYADTISKQMRGNINCVFCCKLHHYSLLPV